MSRNFVRVAVALLVRDLDRDLVQRQTGRDVDRETLGAAPKTERTWENDEPCAISYEPCMRRERAEDRRVDVEGEGGGDDALRVHLAGDRRQ